MNLSSHTIKSTRCTFFTIRTLWFSSVLWTRVCKAKRQNWIWSYLQDKGLHAYKTKYELQWERKIWGYFWLLRQYESLLHLSRALVLKIPTTFFQRFVKCGDKVKKYPYDYCNQYRYNPCHILSNILDTIHYYTFSHYSIVQEYFD